MGIRLLTLIALVLIGSACSSDSDNPSSVLRFTNLVDGQEIDGPIAVTVESSQPDVEFYVDTESEGQFVDGTFEWYPIGQGEVTVVARAEPDFEASVDVVLVPRCGDGVLDGTELCDDTNLALGDGCDDTCNLEIETGAPIWATQIGAEARADISDLAVDELGNSYVVGKYRGELVAPSAPAVPDDGEDNHLYMAKIDANGTVLWTRGFGGEYATLGFIELAEDAIVISGEFRGTVNFGGGALREPAGPQHGHYLARLDRDGEHVWSREIEAFEVSEPAVDDAGIWLLVNPTDETVIDGETFTGSTIGDWRYAAVRFDLDGVAQSSFQFRSGLTNDPRLVVAENGDIIIAGASEGPMDLGGGELFGQSESVLERTLFVGRFTPEGQHVWSRGLGAPSLSNRLYSFESLDGAGLVLGGTIGDGVDFGGGAINVAQQEHQSLDGFVAVLESSGEFRWQQILTGPESDKVVDVVATPGGGVYVVGSLREGGSWAGGAVPADDFSMDLAGKFDTDGQLEWSVHWNNFESPEPEHAAVGPRDGLYVATSSIFSVSLGLPDGPESFEGQKGLVVRLAP